MSKEKCENCKYCFGYGGRDACRKNAPIAIEHPIFPYVSADDWCGEFKLDSRLTSVSESNACHKCGKSMWSNGGRAIGKTEVYYCNNSDCERFAVVQMPPELMWLN